jgi:hypothetical protein
MHQTIDAAGRLRIPGREHVKPCGLPAISIAVPTPAESAFAVLPQDFQAAILSGFMGLLTMRHGQAAQGQSL